MPKAKPSPGLLSPSEWAVLRAVNSLAGPATPTAIRQALQSCELPLPTVQALLARLDGRRLLTRHPGDLWGPGYFSLEELLRIQVEDFFEVYLTGIPSGRDIVAAVVEDHFRDETESRD